MLLKSTHILYDKLQIDIVRVVTAVVGGRPVTWHSETFCGATIMTIYDNII